MEVVAFQEDFFPVDTLGIILLINLKRSERGNWNNSVYCTVSVTESFFNCGKCTYIQCV